ATGKTECASNKVLDPITGTCVTSHDGLSDEDYYMQLGADLGDSSHSDSNFTNIYQHWYPPQLSKRRTVYLYHL
ncbi:MAG: hypothetical protein LRY40_07070, partial [Shewanella fodinae]|nr:hypothetical protein [Shewanella fodinae]